MAKDILKIFQDNQALLTGHFKLSSGLHSDKYLQSALVLQYPKILESLAAQLAEYFRQIQIDTVVSPAIGGIVIGQEVARLLGKRAIFTERKGADKMQLRRGFKLKKDEKCLVIEDVITTGGSTREVIDIIKAEGGEVIAVGAIVDRSGRDISFGVPKGVLLKLDVKTYQPEDCPLCKQGLEITSPGSKQK
jgi:orotate phosphoribosyltransferase